ncbi:hypothetical protein TNCV_464961 [Trichonephila clavipes]|nr:hypothetical protein TNCV_464961 [Trichonephila clavipes]
MLSGWMLGKVIIGSNWLPWGLGRLTAVLASIFIYSRQKLPRNIIARVIECDISGEIHYFLEDSRGFRTRQHGHQKMMPIWLYRQDFVKFSLNRHYNEYKSSVVRRSEVETLLPDDIQQIVKYSSEQMFEVFS